MSETCTCQATGENSGVTHMGSITIEGPPLQLQRTSHATTGEVVTAAEETPADAPAVDAGALPERWHGVLVLENTWTTDGRRFATDSLSARPLPLPLRMSDMGHEEGVLVGNIETITRESDRIMGEGTFDLGSDDGQEAARLVRDGLLRWVSVEIEPLEYEITFPDVDEMDPDKITQADDPKLEVTKANLMGATILPLPAFPQAVIAPEGVELPEAAEAGEDAAVGLGVSSAAEPAVAAAGGPLTPLAAWFDDPQLDGPTPLTVEDDGRVYGHAALWGTCHTGRTDVCLSPPRSASDYAYFATGSVHASSGGERQIVRVGQITMATGHAPLTARHRAAAAHYDDTGAAVADIDTGEDVYGIWVAGALRPGLSDEQVRALRASALSGDWRSIGGQLELVALLAVNVPGFPVPAVAAGAALEDGQLSLVAAGIVQSDPVEEKIRTILDAELAPMRAQLALLRRPMVAALDERMAVS